MYFGWLFRILHVFLFRFFLHRLTYTGQLIQVLWITRTPQRNVSHQHMEEIVNFEMDIARKQITCVHGNSSQVRYRLQTVFKCYELLPIHRTMNNNTQFGDCKLYPWSHLVSFFFVITYNCLTPLNIKEIINL